MAPQLQSVVQTLMSPALPPTLIELPQVEHIFLVSQTPDSEKRLI